jgi:hypothetical protein
MQICIIIFENVTCGPLVRHEESSGKGNERTTGEALSWLELAAGAPHVGTKNT